MRLALLAVLAVSAVLALLWIFQRSLIYFPMADLVPPEELGIAGVEDVSFGTRDGLRLGGWFFGLPDASPAPPTVIVFNGNAGNRSYRATLAQALRQRGLQVMLFDYRGYGGNPGSPSEGGLMADGAAAVSYVRSRPDVDPARLVYFGESLGTGVAVGVAAVERPAALVLRSPFTSLADVARRHYPILPVTLLLRDRFSSIERIGRLQVPLLVIAGDADRIVPVDLSRRLHEAALDPKTLVILSGADHNDRQLFEGARVIDAVVTFLQPLR